MANFRVASACVSPLVAHGRVPRLNKLHFDQPMLGSTNFKVSGETLT